VFERRVKIPVGWVAERVFAPFVRWRAKRLVTPEVAVRIPGLAPAFVGYRIALVTDLLVSHNPDLVDYLPAELRVGQTWLYVSAGVGTAAVPFRWGNPPELPVIRLV